MVNFCLGECLPSLPSPPLEVGPLYSNQGVCKLPQQDLGWTPGCKRILEPFLHLRNHIWVSGSTKFFTIMPSQKYLGDWHSPDLPWTTPLLMPTLPVTMVNGHNSLRHTEYHYKLLPWPVEITVYAIQNTITSCYHGQCLSRHNSLCHTEYH